MEENGIVTRGKDGVGLAHPAPASIATILQSAVDKGMDPGALTKLFDLYERVSMRDAAKEFAEAMARFQEHCPPIKKTSTANIATNSGVSYKYKYAELDEIARTIRPLLAAEGLSYSWDSEEDGGKVTCTCTIRHINGHSVSAKFSAPTDSVAKMSGAQKNAAALTFARRQSLIQALGLTTCDPDTDDAPPGKITENQVANIDALIADVGADKARFLKYMGVTSLASIPVAKFASAIKALEDRRNAR